MKKKGQIEFTIGKFILMALGIIVSVLLILGFSVGWGAPNFKITKEECTDEGEWTDFAIRKEISNVTYICMGKDIQLTTGDKFYFDFYKDDCDRIIIEEEPFTVITSYGARKQKLIEEVCEQVEVDEIKYLYKYDLETNPKHVISKQDLTTEWLDENAVCTILCREGKSKECYEQVTVTIIEGLDIKCDEWSVGDYKIEVIK